jgi:hypothetical protein
LSYSDIDQLTNDIDFAGRVRACVVEQAETFRSDARPDFVALANSALRGDGETYLAFTRIVAAAPGIAEGNQPDGDILSSVQANWQVVAGLYFDPEGNPIP